MNRISVDVKNISGIAHHKEVLKILEIPLNSILMGYAKPAGKWEARRRIIDEFDNSLNAYEDPFEILAVPELLII